MSGALPIVRFITHSRAKLAKFGINVCEKIDDKTEFGIGRIGS